MEGRAEMRQKEKLFWIWLAEALGAGSRAFRILIDLYDSPYEMFLLEEAELERIPGLSARVINALSDKSLGRATQIMEICEKNAIGILPYDDENYPKILRDISQPPCVLYYRGELPDWNARLCVGMVGTRRMSAYGLHSAYKISYELARAGAIVVSGMAAGIDGVCAAAAMAAEGTTVAILGCGVDVVYPKHHRPLWNRIAERGVILSEYPPAARPATYHFPQRNRLISGLAQGTVVVEAGVGSGSLITAREAVVQGRDVYALPANVGSRGAEGTNGLIRDGATPVLSAEDILEPYQHLFPNTLHPDRIMEAGDASRADLAYLERMGVVELTRPQNAQPSAQTLAASKPRESDDNATSKVSPRERKTSTAAPTPETKACPDGKTAEAAAKDRKTPDEVLTSLTPVQRAVLEGIPDDRAVTADTLCGLGYPYGDVIAALTMLEILGLIQKLPGALYTKS